VQGGLLHALERRHALAAQEALTPPPDGALARDAGVDDLRFSVLAIGTVHAVSLPGPFLHLVGVFLPNPYI
jgi:hypothetical protein